MNILYAASEAAPFIKTGGLADVAGSLPAALCQKGHDARVILPLYGKIDSAWREKMEFLFYIYVDLAWRRCYCGIFTLNHGGVTYYFVDNEYYFKRDSVYGDMDDGERFAFFSRAIVSLLPLLEWKADIVNCNDWQTALVPIYLRNECSGVKTVFTIHNIEYQGRYGTYTASDVFGLPRELFDSGILRYENDINLMKGAIYQSDRVSTVSPTYAQELRDPFFAHGIHRVIEDNAYKFRGIVNGLDTELYDPWTDKHIAQNYNAFKPAGKTTCKKALCRELGFDENDEGPIISCVSRLVGHKGFDLVAAALEEIVARGMRLIILGTGDKYFEDLFADAERRHHGRVSANIMYSAPRAMAVYAGSDMMLMPSRSEPCGLTQMIAMRYGTVPVVRAAGGLRDTVRPYGTEHPNGFVFYEYSVHGMLGAIDYALSVWQDKKAWTALMKADMREDLSWSASADKYIEMYKSALGLS